MGYVRDLHRLLDKGQYPIVSKFLNEFYPSTPQMHFEKTLLHARYQIDIGGFELAIQSLSRFIFEQEDNKKQITAMLPYLDALAHHGEVELTLKFLKQLEGTIWFDFEFGQCLKFEYNRLKLYTNIILGNFDRAKNIAESTEKLVKEMDDPGVYSKYYMQKARIYDFQGSLLPAIENYKLAMDYAQKADVMIDYLDPLHNISNIYQYQGRYELAVEGYKKEIKHLEEMGFEFYTIITKGDLAWSYFLQGKDELALELLNQCYEYLHDGQFDKLLYLAEVITRTIIIASYSRADLEVEKLYNELEGINLKSNQPKVEIFQKVSQATRLMLSYTFKNMGKAMTIFENIVQKKKVIDIEFRLYAFLSLINILFKNYNYSNQPSILEEIEEWVDKLYKFAEKQESPSMRFQADWIQAKVMLARDKRDEALKLLTKVLKESNQMGFEHIANQIISEIDHIDDDLSKAIDQTDFAYFRHDLTKQMLFSGQIQGREDPKLFFIMGRNGMTIYSHHFGSKPGINENLISSFVKAIDSFGSEAMNHTEVLNQIQYQEYKVLIEPKTNVSLVFVIKGQTYPAQKKLLEFSKALDLPKYQNLFNNKSLLKLKNKDKEKLDTLINTIFVY